MISADWLYSNFGLDITTFALSVFAQKDQVYFNFNQTYPLPELKDVYEKRGKKQSVKQETTSSWDEIRSNFKYDWADPILDAFLKLSSGDTQRKRFPPLIGFRDVIPFENISAAFREKWVLIYLWGKPDDAEKKLQEAFGKEAVIGEWRDGYSVKLTTQEDAKLLLKWLEIR